MKSRKVVRLVSIVAISLVAVSLSATMGIDEEQLLTIRIDNHGRVWWHPGRAKPDNLPRLLPGETQDRTIAYRPDTAALYDILLSQAHSKPRLVVDLLVHPRADYRRLDQVFATFSRVLSNIDDSIARARGVPLGELPAGRMFKPRGGLDRWVDRDDRILNAATAAEGVLPLTPIAVPSQDTYAVRESLGYWAQSARLFDPIEGVDGNGQKPPIMPMMDRADSLTTGYPDVLPKFRICADPQFSDSLQKTDSQLTVTVSVLVSANGESSESRLVRSSGLNVVDSLALEAAERCLFTPATRDGRSVQSRIAFTYAVKPDMLGGHADRPPVPQLVYLEEPVYPDSLRRAGIGGKAYVRLSIGPGGQVGEAMIAQSSGEPSLDAAAVEAARKCRFRSGIPDEDFGETWVIIPYEFISQASR